MRYRICEDPDQLGYWLEPVPGPSLCERWRALRKETMKRLLASLAALTIAGVVAAPSAGADVTPLPGGGCTITGILVIIALNGPVNICDNQTGSPSSTTNTVDPSLNVSPHLFAPAP